MFSPECGRSCEARVVFAAGSFVQYFCVLTVMRLKGGGSGHAFPLVHFVCAAFESRLFSERQQQRNPLL